MGGQPGVYPEELRGYELKKGDPRTKEIQAMGCRTPSKKRDLSRRISWMRRKGATDESIQRTLDFIQSSELATVDILEYLQKIADLVVGDPKMMLGVTTKMIDLHKQHHGTRNKNDNTNVNINASDDTASKMLNLLIKKSEQEKREENNIIDITPEEPPVNSVEDSKKSSEN